MADRFRSYFIYNVVGSLVPIATAFVSVPLYIHRVGADRYGLIAIAWLLLGYFGFLDFGLSRASVNSLSSLSHAPPSERSPVIMTALYLNLGLGAFGGLVMYVLGKWLLGQVFRIPDTLQAEAFAAFPYVAAMLPVGMLSGVVNGVLESRNRFLAANALTSIGNVVGQVLPLAVAEFVSPTLPYVIPSMLIVRLATVAVTLAIVLRLEWPVRLLDLHVAWIRRLFGYGAWVSVSSLISPLLDGLDQMLIGSVLGPAATAHYAVPMNLSLRSQLVALSLARTLFPQLSRATPVEARRLALHAAVGLAYGFGAVCGPAVLVSHAFLELWVGREFAVSAAPVAAILLAGAWVNGVGFIPYSLIQAQGRPDITAKVHTAEIIPFVILLWFLMHWFGLPGAAWAWTIRVTMDCVALLMLSCLLGKLTWRFGPGIVLMAACYIFSGQGASVAIVFALIAFAAFAGIGLMLEPSLRDLARSVLARLGWKRVHG